MSIKKTLATLGLAIVVPFLVQTIWIVVFNNAMVMTRIEPYHKIQLLLIAMEFGTSSIAGFLFLVRTWGWGQIRWGIIYFPAMFWLMFWYGFWAVSVIFGAYL